MRRTRTFAAGSVVLTAVLLLAAGWALADGAARPGVDAAAAAAAEERPYQGDARGAGAGPPASTRRINLQFVDAELIDVFQALATQSGVNIATSGSVKGTTTLRLRNVTLEQAMNIVTKLNGLDYAWVEAAYVVGTPEEVSAMRVADLRTSVVVLQHIDPEYAQEVLVRLTPDVTVSAQKGVRSILLLGTESSIAKAQRALAEIDVEPLPSPPTTEIVPARYLKAEQLADMIQAAVPDVTIQPGPQENSLLITADALQWKSVRSVVSASDVPPPLAQATKAVYYVKYASSADLVDTLASLAPDVSVTPAPRSFTPSVMKPTGGAGGTVELLAAPQYGGPAAGGAAAEAQAAPVTALIITGAPWSVEQALVLLEELDSPPLQVHIAALVTEVNRDDVTTLGIDWGPTESEGLGLTGSPLVLGEVVSGTNTIDGSIASRDLQIGTIERSFLYWTATIHALEQEGRAQILANPSVTTLNGRQTTLHTGETYYYEVAVAAATTGGIVKDIRTFDTGISLIVSPRVNNDDEVTMTISPIVAALRGTSEFDLPVVTERAVVTTVRVRSGETAVIAGLVSDEEQITLKKVPFLGDIPLVGELFKHRERRPSHQEILVFVTPTIVGDLEDVDVGA
jgi:type II secretion system protein D